MASVSSTGDRYNLLSTAVTASNGTMWQSLTTTGTDINRTWIDDVSIVTSNAYNNVIYQTPKKVHQFNRINELVGHQEGDKFKEPLDELRLKVSRWLCPN